MLTTTVYVAGGSNFQGFLLSLETFIIYLVYGQMIAHTKE